MTTSARYALEGKVVTMEAAGVLERGVVYVRGRDIVAVQEAGAAPPAGFRDAPLVHSGGTLYPGLIDLCRRPAYSILPLPPLARRFEDRDRWERDPDWERGVAAPLRLLLDAPRCRPALARYHEAACLLAGVTSAPGLIAADPGTGDAAAPAPRSLVRRLEAPGDPDLPPAAEIQAAAVAWAEADAGALDEAGGPGESGPRGAFVALTGRERPPAALETADFEALVRFGAALAWTPLADLQLFGLTVELDTARAAGVHLALGSGASPLGSRNLLEELKVAYLYGRAYGSPFSARELVAMATLGAARALHWETALGSLAAGKRADLLVVDGRGGDPYQRLLEARESSISLVVAGGVPVCGQARLMAGLGLDVADSSQAEALAVGRARRIWNLAAGGGQGLGPGRAGSLLRAALGDLPALARELGLAAAEGSAGVDVVAEIELAPLTVVDGGGAYFERLAAQPSLPGWLVKGLAAFYGRDEGAAGRSLMPDPALAEFVRGMHPEVQAQFATAFDLAAFLQTAGRLSLEDRRGIVEQALVLLERIYVHLPLKRAMHAIDPVQRLRLLQYHLEEEDEEDLPSELAFHNELTEIFTSTRDLHTNYLLPRPYRDKTAFLPFMVEEYYDEEGRPHYLVSKIVGQGWPESFRPGVELLYWNGVPIRRAVEVLAAAQAGGNPDARHARALDSLTIRPLVRLLPPDEEWVTLHYRGRDGHGGGEGDDGGDGGEVHEVRHRWRVFTPEAGEGGVAPDALRAEAAVLGFDLQTDAIHQVKKVLYAPEALAAERRIARAQADRLPPPAGMSTNMPTVFRARRVPDEEDGPYGYIRIFTFNVDDAGAFVDEFVRLARLLPTAGLIVDVRGNGGGLIYAAERLLQVLTPRRIEPEPAQFLNTPLALDLCRRHRPSRLLRDFDLGPWIDSISQAVRTGATYSRGFAITPPEACNDRGQQYSGPVLLVTDALCYSATDIFSAGFQDHDIGPILGTSGNTGAGGANVWSHELLQMLMNDPDNPYVNRPGSPFRPLPHGASMRAAVRRTLRVGPRAGVPLEDLGVVPTHRHDMTWRDLMEGNADLIDEACRILDAQEGCELTVQAGPLTGDPAAGQVLQARLTMRNLDRLDVFLGGRPQGSLDAIDGERGLVLQVPPPGADDAEPDAVLLRLEGYRGGSLVAARRLKVPRRGP